MADSRVHQMHQMMMLLGEHGHGVLKAPQLHLSRL